MCDDRGLQVARPQAYGAVNIGKYAPVDECGVTAFDPCRIAFSSADVEFE